MCRWWWWYWCAGCRWDERFKCLHFVEHNHQSKIHIKVPLLRPLVPQFRVVSHQATPFRPYGSVFAPIFVSQTFPQVRNHIGWRVNVPLRASLRLKVFLMLKMPMLLWFLRVSVSFLILHENGPCWRIGGGMGKGYAANYIVSENSNRCT